MWYTSRSSVGVAASGASNKPMLPTADTRPAGNPMDPMRRLTGRPLARPEGT